MAKPFYITTPLYYVNAKPHIGHAYTNILCDMFARWHRLMGEEVFFMTGTDEHGTKIDKAARELGKEPKTYADEMMPEFKKLWELLGIKYDYFIRTTDSDHKQIVQNILRELEKKGDIYKGKYTGWYCTPCESFWTKLQLVEGKCPDCKRDVQELSEENYFFKLAEHQKWLIQYIRDNPNFIRPEIRKNEILGFLNEPLEDLCITRPRARLSWGIDYPSSKEHIVYVWFDALINYVSGIGYSVDSKRFNSLWPADVHMVGKDILRHHAVYWPIMLKAMGVKMPQTILAHGWWTMSGAKVSKSRGNAVDPVELCKTYGVDAFRYFLLREVTLGLDGAFSEDLLAERYTSDLANDLGNLVMRSTSMLERYFNGVLPQLSNKGIEPFLLPADMPGNIRAVMTNCDPRTALGVIWIIVKRANQYVEEKKPWVLSKEKKTQELADALFNLLETVYSVAIMLQAFMPETSRKILSCFGEAKEASLNKFFKEDSPIWPMLKPGMKIDKGEILFPKLDEEKVEK